MSWSVLPVELCASVCVRACGIIDFMHTMCNAFKMSLVHTCIAYYIKCTLFSAQKQIKSTSLGGDVKGLLPPVLSHAPTEAVVQSLFSPQAENKAFALSSTEGEGPGEWQRSDTFAAACAPSLSCGGGTCLPHYHVL